MPDGHPRISFVREQEPRPLAYSWYTVNEIPPKSMATQISHLEAETESLRGQLEELREVRRKRDFRKLVLLGLAVSIPFHLLIIAYLASYHLGGSGSGFDQDEGIEFTVLSSTELQEMQEEIQVEDVTASELEVDESLSSMLANLDDQMASAAVTELDVDGSAPTPGGVVGFSESTNSDAGLLGSASFFGIGSRGRRFGFIIDLSTSMRNPISMREDLGMGLTKFDLAVQQFSATIGRLPDYVQVYTLLFAGSLDSLKAPAFQKSWLSMNDRNKERLITWLAQRTPDGSTEPYKAFQKIFSLRNRPDVIYFLTDGIFDLDVPEKIAALNQKGRKVVINTIALGGGAALMPLEKIARESGGQCIRYPARGGGGP